MLPDLHAQFASICQPILSNFAFFSHCFCTEVPPALLRLTQHEELALKLARCFALRRPLISSLPQEGFHPSL